MGRTKVCLVCRKSTIGSKAGKDFVEFYMERRSMNI